MEFVFKIDLGDRLIGAFDTPSKLPYSDVNLQTKEPKLPVWGPDSSLSEVTSVQLEMRDLSRASKNPIYEVDNFYFFSIKMLSRFPL